MTDCAVNFACDPQFRENGHPVQRFFKIRHDPVVVGIEQPVFILPWAMVMPDRVHVLFFVNPDQAFLLLHPNIARHLLVVANDGELCFKVLKLWYILSDKVMVRHRCHGELQSGPFAHLTRVSAARIYDVFACDCTFFGFNHPISGVFLCDVCCAAVSENPHTLLTCARCHGHGHIGWVYVSIIRSVERSDNAIEIVEGVL